MNFLYKISLRVMRSYVFNLRGHGTNFYQSTLLDSYNLIDCLTGIELCTPTACSEYLLHGTRVIEILFICSIVGKLPQDTEAQQVVDRGYISNTQRTENETTDVVIQQHSRKLLMMDILMSETC